MFKGNVERIRDGELQSHFPDIPVTETTRNILIKKLKNNMNAQNKNQATYTRRTDFTPSYEQHRYSSYSPLEQLPTTSSPSLMTTAARKRWSDESSPRPTFLSDPYSRQTPKNNPYSMTQESCKSHVGVVKRLLNLRDMTIGQRLFSNNIKCSTTSMDTFFTKRIENQKSVKGSLSSGESESNSIFNLLQLKYKQSCIPHVLLCALIGFFVSLFCIYIVIKPDIFSAGYDRNMKFSICRDYNAPGQTFICIKTEQLNFPSFVTEQIIQFLMDRAIKHYCEDHSISHVVSAHEILEHCKSSLAFKPQKFKVELLDAFVKDSTKLSSTVKSTDNSITNARSLIHSLYYEIQNPGLPFFCSFKRKTHHFFMIIGSGIIVSLVTFLCYGLYQLIMKRRADRLAVVNNLYAAILNELKSQAFMQQNDNKAEIVINHLRDKLIPTQKQKNLSWAWKKALELLETNESRVQFGSTLQNGEEFQTIKWIGEILNTNEPEIRKQWQSPAFGNSNKILKPPTPCLKIRHMFDASEANLHNLKQIIETAILEKVGSKCVIKDIQLDTHSCCVYILCRSEADAGVVHNEINGWWFDNRLISIKFLRLQRYLSRFPTP